MYTPTVLCRRPRRNFVTSSLLLGLFNLSFACLWRWRRASISSPTTSSTDFDKVRFPANTDASSRRCTTMSRPHIGGSSPWPGRLPVGASGTKVTLTRSSSMRMPEMTVNAICHRWRTWVGVGERTSTANSRSTGRRGTHATTSPVQPSTIQVGLSLNLVASHILNDFMCGRLNWLLARPTGD